MLLQQDIVGPIFREHMISLNELAKNVRDEENVEDVNFFFETLNSHNTQVKAANTAESPVKTTENARYDFKLI